MFYIIASSLESVYSSWWYIAILEMLVLSRHHLFLRHIFTQKAKPIVSQRRLDIEYARYIQWLYLDAKIHKVFEEQEKEAMVWP